ncbi:hypothetical protein EVA_05087 [gut metagenome]|uniref:Uncharacterized protein n=1 Tax=gut metagenome TaxID=749906 RepID=J9D2G3_9ZZZZ
MIYPSGFFNWPPTYKRLSFRVVLPASTWANTPIVNRFMSFLTLVFYPVFNHTTEAVLLYMYSCKYCTIF